MDPSNEAGPVFDRFGPESGITLAEIALTGPVISPLTGSATGEAELATANSRARGPCAATRRRRKQRAAR